MSDATESAFERAQKPNHHATCMEDGCTFGIGARSRELVDAERARHEEATGHETEVETARGGDGE